MRSEEPNYLADSKAPDNNETPVTEVSPQTENEYDEDKMMADKKARAIESISKATSFSEIRELLTVAGGVEGSNGKFYDSDSLNKMILGIEEITGSDKWESIVNLVKENPNNVIMSRFTNSEKSGKLRDTLTKLIIKAGEIKKLNEEILKA